MSRSINPAPQWIRGGEPLGEGKMYFFDTGTNTPKKTFADSDETIANTHPVILDADGVLPNVFYTGLAKQVLTDKDDVQIFNKDPVGQEEAISSFDIYSGGSTYQINQIVTTSDGRFFKSLINGNIGFDPLVDNGTHWQEIKFSDFYAAGVTFSVDDRVISAVDGLSYISVVNNNKGNEPSVDDGSNWVLDDPVLDWVTGKEYEINEKARSKIDFRVYVSQLQQSGNEPSADPGNNWVPADGRVVKPVNLLPSDASIDVSKTPLLTTDAFATLGITPQQEWSEFQLSKDGFTSIDYTSGMTRDLTEHQVTERLDIATTYSYRVIKKGVRTDISEFSDVTTFTTGIDFSLVFDDVFFTGTGAALSVITTVDLNSNTGAVFINDNDTATAMRIVDTVRGVGNAITAGLGFNEVVEATGLTSFNVNGFDVGADVNYNNSGDSIYSLSYKKQTGLFDIVQTSGTGVNRTDAHALSTEVGLMINFQISGASPVGSPAHYCWFRGMSGSKHLKFATVSSVTTDGSVWNSTSPTTANFSLGTSTFTNGTARNYTTYLFAHNPLSGRFCGSYVGTGVSGNKIVTGFAVQNFIGKADAIEDWFIFNKTLGTSTQIILDTTAETAAGGPESFDSDGITVGATHNDLGVTYFFMADAGSSF